MFRPFAALLTLLAASAVSSAQDLSVLSALFQPTTKSLSVEELTNKTKPSIVVILHTGRQGKAAGLGTGFVVGEGLIATNFHVIGESRPITVQFPDGTKHDVISVHASDRHLDLAVVKIDVKGLKPLPQLQIGDSDKLRDGQAISALGHPLGLKYSVVAGVLSGKREIEGVEMLQIAMPIEPGNSGGPVLDSSGKVVGIVSMKSLVTDNLGFAIPSKHLAAMLKKPNPVPMSRWVTLGVLEKTDWMPSHGGTWRQRAGHIIGEGQGSGFGGRSFCFRVPPAPKPFPYEIRVSVKLDSEAGAAGLFFGGNDGDKHFGFYPTAGKLRLTQFAGPDVTTWKILDDFTSPRYKPGEWNALKVRVEKNKVVCFVNEQQVLERGNLTWFGTRHGLAKFRDTVAEFKGFQVGKNLSRPMLTAADQKKLDAAVAEVLAGKRAMTPFLKTPGESMKLLREKAVLLEKQADELRKLAQGVYSQGVLEELTKLTQEDDAKMDLLRGALLIARLDNEDVEIAPYLREVDRMAHEIRATLPKDADGEATLAAMNKYLFEERGFRGSRGDYYTRSNSYLNEVIDDREGLPITLSVLYLEIARRLNLPMVGVALPGHFVVRYEPVGLPPYFIDVYEGGASMTNTEAQTRVVKATGAMPKKKDFRAASKKTILTRILSNLLTLADADKDRPAMLRYLDAMVAIEPKSYEERWVRAVLRFQAGMNDESAVDCDWLIDNAPDDEIDLDRVRELRRRVAK
jgi:regulator of sirC expression with transglutaminase-like and TPR domain/S1-C subfamily serine protease